jgi:hypothetical protein
MPKRRLWLMLLATPLLLIALAAGVVLFSGHNNGIAYPDLEELVTSGKIKAITFVGQGSIVVEVRDPEDEAVRGLSLRHGTFYSSVPPGSEWEDCMREMLKKDPSLKVSWREKQSIWPF